MHGKSLLRSAKVERHASAFFIKLRPLTSSARPSWSTASLIVSITGRPSVAAVARVLGAAHGSPASHTQGLRKVERDANFGAVDAACALLKVDRPSTPVMMLSSSRGVFHSGVQSTSSARSVTMATMKDETRPSRASVTVVSLRGISCTRKRLEERKRLLRIQAEEEAARADEPGAGVGGPARACARRPWPSFEALRRPLAWGRWREMAHATSIFLRKAIVVSHGPLICSESSPCSLGLISITSSRCINNFACNRLSSLWVFKQIS